MTTLLSLGEPLARRCGHFKVHATETAVQHGSGNKSRMDDLDYLQRRERQERAAAKRAATFAARQAHQEMALRYSVMIIRLLAQPQLEAA